MREFCVYLVAPPGTLADARPEIVKEMSRVGLDWNIAGDRLTLTSYVPISEDLTGFHFFSELSRVRKALTLASEHLAGSTEDGAPSP